MEYNIVYYRPVQLVLLLLPSCCAEEVWGINTSLQARQRKRVIALPSELPPSLYLCGS